MNYTGIVIGFASFFIIGIFHPIVIKAEYYFGKQCWWAFAIGGVLFALGSLLAGNVILSSLSGVTAFSRFWSILELFEREKRVKKGWFPSNPGRKSGK